MKRALVLGLLLWAWTSCVQAQGPIGPPNYITCNSAVQVAAGSTGVAQIVAAVSGQSIFVCGWSVTNSGASGNFQLSYGTGANCGTGNTTLTPALNVGSTPTTDHTQYATMNTPKGTALCFNPSANTISALVYTAQF